MRLRSFLVSCVVVAAFAACSSTSTQSPIEEPVEPGGGSPTAPAEPTPTTPPEDGPTETNPPATSSDSGAADASADAASNADSAPVPCNLPSGTGYFGTQWIDFAGTQQSYVLDIGYNYDGQTRLPLTLVFHGDGMTGDQIRSWMSLEDESGGNGIFVYPNGPYQTWDCSTPYGINSDYALVDAIVADIESKLCVDTKRVFAWGISRGASFVNMLGCYRGNTFRGIIANSGAGPSSQNPADYDGGQFFLCPTQPVAAMIIHGDADQTIDFSAGVDAANHWSTVNKCSSQTTPIDPSPCVSYAGCQRPVIWCALPGWPHELWGPSNAGTWAFIESMK
ncbi:MAG: hypothetical protein FWD69_02710 [Polyangiaceae bacterium]|nr:hypothetical protein [Polyangiaceae bacterium]